MDSYPFVSIIIPTLNEEEYIEACLDSVLEQTYPIHRMEIFVLDGGSTDRTIELVKMYQQTNIRITQIHNPKRNQAAAFNLGFENSNGNYIIRLDAHSVYDKEYVRICIENHQENVFGNVGGRWIIQPGSDSEMGRAIAEMNQSPFVMGGADFRNSVSRKLTETVPFGCFPRSVIDDVGTMNENLHRGEDNEYNARIISAGYRILYDPKIIAYYVARGTMKEFLKQMYANGFSIGILLRNYSKSVSNRHLIPLLALLLLLAGLVLSIFFEVPRIALLSIIGFYFLLDMYFAFRRVRNYTSRVFLYLVSITPFVHLSYGIGTLEGIIRKRYQT